MKYTTRNAARPVRRRCLRFSLAGCRAPTAGSAYRRDPSPSVPKWTSIVRSPESSRTERAACSCGARWGWACSVPLDGFGVVRHRARTHRRTALQENRRVQTIERDAGVGRKMSGRFDACVCFCPDRAGTHVIDERLDDVSTRREADLSDGAKNVGSDADEDNLADNWAARACVVYEASLATRDQQKHLRSMPGWRNWQTHGT